MNPIVKVMWDKHEKKQLIIVNVVMCDKHDKNLR